MPGRYKKLGLKDIRYSGKYILASVIVEGLLLAPKTTIKWQGKDVQIGGIIPMLQKEIAAGVRDGLNAVLPKAATTVENTFRQTPIKDIAIEKILWFVYDYMKDVTLNSLVTTVLDRANLSDTIKLEGLFRDRLQDVIDNKDDREKLIAGLADFLINTANTVFAGTSVAAFLNGGLGDNVKATVAEYIDKWLDTELGGTVVTRVLDAVEQFETHPDGGRHVEHRPRRTALHEDRRHGLRSGLPGHHEKPLARAHPGDDVRRRRRDVLPEPVAQGRGETGEEDREKGEESLQKEQQKSRQGRRQSSQKSKEEKVMRKPGTKRSRAYYLLGRSESAAETLGG